MDVTLNADLAALVTSLHRQRTIDVGATAESIVAFAVETLDVDQAGITLLGAAVADKPFESVAPTGPEVRAADQLQFQLGEGPCLEAAAEHRTVLSSDLLSEDRWRRWAPAACDLGFRSVLSAQLFARDQHLGSLNLYARSERPFTWEDAHTAHLFARHAAAALAAATHDEGMHRALETRGTIGQAQGMLMERFGVDAEQAFAILRRYSQERNVKLRDIAGLIVEGASMTSPELPEP